MGNQTILLRYFFYVLQTFNTGIGKEKRYQRFRGLQSATPENYLNIKCIKNPQKATADQIEPKQCTEFVGQKHKYKINFRKMYRFEINLRTKKLVALSIITFEAKFDLDF